MAFIDLNPQVQVPSGFGAINAIHEIDRLKKYFVMMVSFRKLVTDDFMSRPGILSIPALIEMTKLVKITLLYYVILCNLPRGVI